MNFKCHSVAILCGVLLLAGCGEIDEAPSLPGPVQVDGSQFVSAEEYLYTPGSVLETTSLRLDFINPKFDQGVAVRDTSSQGSGEARQTDIEADLAPVGDFSDVANPSIGDDDGVSDNLEGVDSDVLAIQLADTLPPLDIHAYAPNDAKLFTQVYTLPGMTLISNNLNDQRVRLNTTFTDTVVDEEGEVIARMTLRVTRILVNNAGNQVVLEGSASLISDTINVLNETTGEVTEDVSVVLNEGSFSASFLVKEKGLAGDGSGEDPLSLLARLDLAPNNAEIVYQPTQSGTQSVLYAPDAARTNILTNQLVRIRRLLNGTIQAEFDPANGSTVLNFVQTNPPQDSLPTPVPQLTPSDTTGGPPDVFDYFFSLRTERDDEESPVVLEGFAPTTGDFIFRTLAGAQLAGPYNRADVGGGLQRGNFRLVFDQNLNADGILGTSDDYVGTFELEQEYPTFDDQETPDEDDTNAGQGSILLIRGFFAGPQVNL